MPNEELEKPTDPLKREELELEKLPREVPLSEVEIKQIVVEIVEQRTQEILDAQELEKKGELKDVGIEREPFLSEEEIKEIVLENIEQRVPEIIQVIESEKERTAAEPEKDKEEISEERVRAIIDEEAKRLVGRILRERNLRDVDEDLRRLTEGWETKTETQKRDIDELKTVLLHHRHQVYDRTKAIPFVGSQSRVRVTLDGNQSVTLGALRQLEFDEEDYDSLSEYNTTNYRFTAKTSGYYLAIVRIRVAAMTDLIVYDLYIRKNGSSATGDNLYFRHTASGTASATIMVTGIIQLDAGEYLEAYADFGDTQTVNASGSYFEIHKLST